MLDSPHNNNNNEYNVVDSFWFNKIGIVKVRSTDYTFKYYIGVGKGDSQTEDEQLIAATGSPVSPYALKMFFDIV